METFTVPPMRAVAIAVLHALLWLTSACGFGVRPAAATEASATASQQASPQDVMADLTARLFAALDTDAAAMRHDVGKALPFVDGLLSAHFDKEYAARLVLGHNWRGATADQRQQFGFALYRRLLRTYIGAVANWSADRVRILPLHRDAAALQVTVHTLVTNSRGANVPVDYRLRQTPDGWKIFDVLVEGVSYMRNYRDDIDEQVAHKGLDATIDELARSNPGSAERTPSSNSPAMR
jgi:phospholipid transport system substrate-binding protein